VCCYSATKRVTNLGFQGRSKHIDGFVRSQDSNKGLIAQNTGEKPFWTPRAATKMHTSRKALLTRVPVCSKVPTFWPTSFTFTESHTLSAMSDATFFVINLFFMDSIGPSRSSGSRTLDPDSRLNKLETPKDQLRNEEVMV